MISPWVIYFCHFADDIKIISFLIGFVLGLFWLIKIMIGPSDLEESDSTRRLGIMACMFLFIAVIVPSKKACIEMLVVSMITPETFAIGKDKILDFVKEVMQIISAK